MSSSTIFHSQLHFFTYNGYYILLLHLLHHGVWYFYSIGYKNFLWFCHISSNDVLFRVFFFMLSGANVTIFRLGNHFLISVFHFYLIDLTVELKLFQHILSQLSMIFLKISENFLRAIKNEKSLLQLLCVRKLSPAALKAVTLDPLNW